MGVVAVILDRFLCHLDRGQSTAELNERRGGYLAYLLSPWSEMA